MSDRQAVFTITRGVPFLPALAEALLAGRLVGPVAEDPLALAAVTIYLPTRRAARALGALGGEGETLLPPIDALRDVALRIAVVVAQAAVADGVATVAAEELTADRIGTLMWAAAYD